MDFFELKVPSLTRPTEKTYKISRGRDAVWRCTCPDYQFRGGRRQQVYACKHIRALMLDLTRHVSQVR